MRRARGPRGGARADTAWRARTASVLLVSALLLAGCAPGDDAAAPEAAGPERDAPPPTAAPAPGDGEREARAVPDPGPDDADGADAPADDEPPPPPEGREALTGQLERVLGAAHAELSAARIGVLVVDEHGRQVVAHEPDAALLPASTQKLVTAAGLLRTLGPDARLTTTVEATAPIEEGGALRGDLLLRGGGDPALATDDYGRWVYPARPRTPLEALADDLVAAGLQRLRGDIVVDATGFVGPTRAEGWPDRYFASLDARMVHGLTVDAGLETLVSFPDAVRDDEEDEDGDEAPGEGPADRSERRPGDADEEAGSADEGDGRVRARPRPRDVPDDVDPADLGAPRVRVQAADDPAVQAGVELVRLLEERDVRVDGGAVPGPVDAPAVGRLARVESPPLHELLRFTVQQSDNHLADTLFHVLGRVRTGEGSWDGGARAAEQVLALLGVDHAGAVLADGSGLSRDDRLTARLLVDLDRAMTEHRHAEVWRSLMAVAGESGTLRTRLRGTPAQGRVLGKTGTLRDVSALSGVVDGDDGRRYHFAVLANDAQGADRAVLRTMVDELALLLAADLQACRATRADDTDDTPLGRPPLLVRC